MSRLLQQDETFIWLQFYFILGFFVNVQRKKSLIFEPGYAIQNHSDIKYLTLSVGYKAYIGVTLGESGFPRGAPKILCRAIRPGRLDWAGQSSRPAGFG